MMRSYQGFLIALVTTGGVNPSAGQNLANPKIPQTSAWSYEQFTDVTGKPILTAELEGTDGIYITIEQHPRWGSSAYIFFLLHSGKELDCEQSCVINIRFDDGKPEPWPVLGPMMNAPSLGVPLAQVEELITKLRNSHHFTIDAPVLAMRKRASFDFYSTGIVWPPPPSLISIRTEGIPLAERNGLHTGGPYRWRSMPACFYMPSPPITIEATAANFQGTVEIEGTVTAEGKIDNIKILKSPGLGLNESVINTVKTWKCKPAIGPDGEPLPVAVTFQIKINRY